MSQQSQERPELSGDRPRTPNELFVGAVSKAAAAVYGPVVPFGVDGGLATPNSPSKTAISEIHSPGYDWALFGQGVLPSVGVPVKVEVTTNAAGSTPLCSVGWGGLHGNYSFTNLIIASHEDAARIRAQDLEPMGYQVHCEDVGEDQLCVMLAVSPMATRVLQQLKDFGGRAVCNGAMEYAGFVVSEMERLQQGPEGATAVA